MTAAELQLEGLGAVGSYGRGPDLRLPGLSWWRFWAVINKKAPSRTTKLATQKMTSHRMSATSWNQCIFEG